MKKQKDIETMMSDDEYFQIYKNCMDLIQLHTDASKLYHDVFNRFDDATNDITSEIAKHYANEMYCKFVIPSFTLKAFSIYDILKKYKFTIPEWLENLAMFNNYLKHFGVKKEMLDLMSTSNGKSELKELRKFFDVYNTIEKIHDFLGLICGKDKVIDVENNGDKYKINSITDSLILDDIVNNHLLQPKMRNIVISKIINNWLTIDKIDGIYSPSILATLTKNNLFRKDCNVVYSEEFYLEFEKSTADNESIVLIFKNAFSNKEKKYTFKVVNGIATLVS